ncbi:MAG: hypothetical protein DDT24_00481 [Chloroflexi bacterium]|nr:hypothetical protein [Chloroflexota bacterium]
MYVAEEEEPIEEEIPVSREVPMPIFPGVEVPPQEVVEVMPPPEEVPGWAIYSTAGAVGILLAYLILRWRRGKTTRHLWEKEVSQAASRAAEELRQGLPIANVVTCCWVRMVEILSRQTTVRDSHSLTPREFTGLLRGRGFSDGAIERLTYLFEEVRYGGKAAEPRREEALIALSAIERAYGET